MSGSTLASAPSPDGGGGLATLLHSGRLSRRARQAATVALTAQVAWQTGKQAYHQVRQLFAYTVAVGAEDDIYPAVHRWLVENIPDRRRRSLTLATGQTRSGVIMPEPDGRSRRSALVDLFYDGRREHTIPLDGHNVRVSLEREGPPARTQDEARQMSRFFQERIVFTAFGPAARDAVIAFLSGLAEDRAKEDRQPSFWIATRWGDWMSRVEIGSRPLQSVVLRTGQAEELVDDLAKFLASEADYLRLGMPWHRGYLLHGPPGTGKTSIAAALANYFDLDLYWLPLSDLQRDANLMQLISAVRPGAMLLLEDVDVLHAATSRDDEQPGVTLSGLLNALDGVGTPHGLITVMTTNRLEVLDEALVRPGRIDRREHISFLDDDQLRRLVRQLMPDATIGQAVVEDREVPAAAVVEIIKRHLDNPAAVGPAIAAMIEAGGAP